MDVVGTIRFSVTILIMNYDIAIVGGGIVGKALALMLAQQTSLSIALCEAEFRQYEWLKEKYHHRVSAISLASQRILQAIEVWDAIKTKRVSPFNQIQVWDAEGQQIDFDSKSIAELVLGYIVENNLIQQILEEKIVQYSQIKYFSPIKLTELILQDNQVVLATDGKENIIAKLVIGADGANSWVRAQSKISHSRHDYEQNALVATVCTALPHGKIAKQVFLKNGPLAFLPLADANFSSIVWTLPQQEAKQLLLLDESSFQDELATAFSYRLGKIISIDKRYSFPLYQQQVRNYATVRVALVGDAAQVVHPLAGQGLNIGLLDAASLAQVIHHSQQKNLDIGGLNTLKQYDRWRKADNFAMLKSIDLLKNAFANDKKTFTHWRILGMNALNRLRWLKKIFIHQAVGNRHHLPFIATADFLSKRF